MIIYNIEQGSEAWYEARLGRVTGTRFKSLVSGEGTATYKDLITTITGEIISGEVEETYSNQAMERGKELEQYARHEYESLFDYKVQQVGFIIPDEGTEFHEYIGISPDGITEGIQEFKCPLMKAHLNYIEANKMPNEYKWQVQGQLFTTGLPWCDFMSYYPNMKPFILRVYPDGEMFKIIEDRLRKLIDDIKQKLNMYNNYDYLSK